MEAEIKPVELKVVKNGPLIVKGPVKMVLPDGSVEETKKVFICRCGKTSNEPYCDGSHAK
ncbi:hypothetical protein MASR1M31_23730 [Porphyromonadaceae bacterium]